MALSAKRFKVLDDETNIPTLDFTDVKTADLFNSPNLELRDMDADMTDFVKQAAASKSFDLSPLKDKASTLVRSSKDIFSAVKDVSSLSPSLLDKAISDLIPNASAQSAFKKLAPACRTGPMGHHNSGKPFDTNIDCNGKSRTSSGGGCTNGFSNVLNAISGGLYNSSSRDLNSALSNLVSLATTGYKMNMCGVFGALSGGLPNLVQSRGASSIMGMLGGTSNLRGVFDIAKSTVGSGFALTKDLPGMIPNVFNNFKTPFDAKQTEFPSLNDSINESMFSFDKNWNKSSADSILSCSFIDKPSVDYDAILRSDAMKFNVSSDDLDIIPDSVTNLTRSGMIAKASSSFGGLSDFGSFT